MGNNKLLMKRELRKQQIQEKKDLETPNFLPKTDLILKQKQQQNRKLEVSLKQAFIPLPYPSLTNYNVSIDSSKEQIIF